MKKIVGLLIDKFLHDYVNDIGSKITLLNIFSGKSELKDVEIKKTALSQHGLPLEIINGKISNINFIFPWYKKDKNITVKVSNILFICNFNWDLLEKTYQERDSNAIVRITSSKNKERKKNTAVGFTNKILKKLIVDITNVHAILEIPGKSNIIKIGFYIGSICIQTTESDKNAYTKEANVNNIMIYLVSETSRSNYDVLYLTNVEKNTEDKIVNIPNIKMTFKHSIENQGGHSNIIDIVIQNIFLSIDHSQILLILDIAREQRTLHIRSLYHRCMRPQNQELPEMWLFLYRCAVQKSTVVFDRNKALSFLKHRKQYYNIYLKTMDEKLKKKDLKNAKEELEMFRSVFSVEIRSLLELYAQREFDKQNEINKLTDEEYQELLSSSNKLIETFKSYDISFNMSTFRFIVKNNNTPFVCFQLYESKFNISYRHPDIKFNGNLLKLDISSYHMGNELNIFQFDAKQTKNKMLRPVSVTGASSSNSLEVYITPITVNITESFIDSVTNFIKPFLQIKFIDTPSFDVSKVSDLLDKLHDSSFWSYVLTFESIKISSMFELPDGNHDMCIIFEKLINTNRDKVDNFDVNIHQKLSLVKLLFDNERVLDPFNIDLFFSSSHNKVDLTYLFSSNLKIDKLKILNSSAFTKIVPKIYMLVSELLKGRTKVKKTTRVLKKAQPIIGMGSKICFSTELPSFSILLESDLELSGKFNSSLTYNTVDHDLSGKNLVSDIRISYFDKKEQVKLISISKIKNEISLCKGFINVKSPHMLINNYLNSKINHFLEVFQSLISTYSDKVKPDQHDIFSLPSYHINIKVSKLKLKLETLKTSNKSPSMKIPDLDLNIELSTLLSKISIPILRFRSRKYDIFSINDMEGHIYLGHESEFWNVPRLPATNLYKLKLSISLDIGKVSILFHSKIYRNLTKNTSEITFPIIIQPFNIRSSIKKLVFSTPISIPPIFTENIFFSYSTLDNAGKFSIDNILIKFNEENLFEHSQKFIECTYRNDLIDFSITPFSINLVPEYFGPLVQYILSSRIKLPKLNLILDMDSVRVFIFEFSLPKLFIRTPIDNETSLSINLAFNANIYDATFTLDYNVKDLRFYNPIVNQEETPIIDNIMGNFIVKIEDGILKQISLMVEDRIKLIISQSDLNYLRKLGNLWMKYPVSLQKKQLKIVTPEIIVNTSEIDFIFAREKIKNRTHPLIKVSFLPVSLTNINSDDAFVYNGAAELNIYSYNLIKNVYVPIATSIIIVATSTIEKQKIHTVVELQNLSFDLHSSLLANFTHKLESNEILNNLKEAPEFWVSSNLSDEAILMFDKKTLQLLYGDFYPEFSIKETTKLSFVVNDNVTSIYPKDLCYPFYTYNYVISKRVFEGGFIIELNPHYAIKNNLGINLVMFSPEPSSIIEQGSIYSLPNNSYLSFSSGYNVKSSNTSYFRNDYSSFDGIVQNGYSKYYFKAYGVFDSIRGIKVYNMYCSTSMFNCLPFDLTVRINSNDFLIKGGEKQILPFVSHSDGLLKVSLALPGYPFSSIHLINVSASSPQKVSVSSSEILLLAIIVENLADGTNNILVYSPSVIYNTSSFSIRIDDPIYRASKTIEPKCVGFWCPESYFDSDNHFVNMTVNEKTSTLENAFDYLHIGYNDNILLKNKSDKTFHPLHLNIKPQLNHSTIVTGVTISDSYIIENNTSSSIFLTPEKSSSTLEVPSHEKRVLSSFTNKRVIFSIDGYCSKPVLMFENSGTYVFVVRSQISEGEKYIEMLVADLLISTTVTFNDKSVEPNISIINNTDKEIIISQGKKYHHLSVQPDDETEFALDEPFESDDLVIKINDHEHFLSLSESNSTSYIMKDDHHLCKEFIFVELYSLGNKQIVTVSYENSSRNNDPYATLDLSASFMNFCLFDLDDNELFFVGINGPTAKVIKSIDYNVVNIKLVSHFIIDQNDSAKNYIILKSERSDALDIKAIIPRDVFLSRRIDYFSLQIQPLTINISHSLLSDIISLVKTFNIKRDTQCRFQPTQPTTFNTSIFTISYFEITNTELQINIEYDPSRSPLYPRASIFISLLPNISRSISLPIFLCVDLRLTIYEFAKEFFGDYLIYFVKYFLNSFGRIKVILDLFKLESSIKNFLSIREHEYFNIKEIVSQHSKSYINRKNFLEVFNLYTIQRINCILDKFKITPTVQFQRIFDGNILGALARPSFYNGYLFFINNRAPYNSVNSEFQRVKYNSLNTFMTVDGLLVRICEEEIRISGERQETIPFNLVSKITLQQGKIYVELTSQGTKIIFESRAPEDTLRLLKYRKDRFAIFKSN